MALFANASDLKIYHDRPTPKLASCNFVASARSSEELAQSGHLAVSAPSQIMGRFQLLKTLRHENLCEYVEIHRGKHGNLTLQHFFLITIHFKEEGERERDHSGIESKLS